MKQYFDLAIKLYELADEAGRAADFNGSSRILDAYEQQVVPKFNAALSALAELCREVDTVHSLISIKQGFSPIGKPDKIRYTCGGDDNIWPFDDTPEAGANG